MINIGMKNQVEVWYEETGMKENEEANEVDETEVEKIVVQNEEEEVSTVKEKGKKKEKPEIEKNKVEESKVNDPEEERKVEEIIRINNEREEKREVESKDETETDAGGEKLEEIFCKGRKREKER